MRAQVRGGKTERAAQLIPANDRPENGIVASQQGRGAGEIAGLDGAADRGAGDDLTVHLHGRHADLIEAELIAHAAEQFEIACPSAAKAPLVTHADFPQGPARGAQLENECLRRRGGELRVERDDQDAFHANRPDEPQLVRSGRQQARRGAWPGSTNIPP